MSERLKVEEDGITHINIYSKGKTELGRLLSNFSKCDLSLPEGDFKSVEGYWYYLGKRDDRLKKSYGFAAKKLGDSLPDQTRLSQEEFQNKIKSAIIQKIIKNKRLYEMVINNKLKYEHYYVYGSEKSPSNPKIIDAGYKWLVDFFNELTEEKLKCQKD